MYLYIHCIANRLYKEKGEFIRDLPVFIENKIPAA